MKFRTKTSEVDAMCFDDVNKKNTIVQWINDGKDAWSGQHAWHNEDDIFITTKGGSEKLSFGFWLVKGEKGFVQVFHPNIFNKTYEPAKSCFDLVQVGVKVSGIDYTINGKQVRWTP